MRTAIIMPRTETLATCFLAVIAGGLLLPVVPLWIGLLYALGAWACMASPGSSRSLRIIILMGAVLAVSAMVAANAMAALADPVGYIKQLFEWNGTEYPLAAGLYVTLYGAIIIAVMVGRQWQLARGGFERTTLALLAAFTLWYHVPALLSALQPLAAAAATDTVVLTQQLSGLVKWNAWIIGALLAATIARQQGNTAARVLRTITWAGVVMAAIVLVQHLTAEYSYILEAPRFADYEFRVRATYTYHAPLSYLLAIALLIQLCTGQLRRRTTWAALALLCLALHLNETRAISLSMLGAAAFIGVCSIYTRASMARIALCFVVAGFFAAHVYHVKISTNTPPVAITAPVPDSPLQAYIKRHAHNLEPLDPKVVVDKGQGYIASNGPRIELLQQGVRLLAGVWIGQGIGNVSIPLSGYNNNGLMTTWSSHSFLVDVGLAAGMIGLVLLLGVIALTWFGALRGVWRHGRTDTNAARGIVAMLACTVFWMLASGFVPQEANFLLPVMFIVMGLMMAHTVNGTNTGDSAVKPCWAALRYALVAGAIVWSVLFSGSWVIPLIEMAMLQRQNPSAHTVIYTNSPKIHFVSKWVLRTLYPPLGQVQKLSGRPDSHEEMWLIWDPAYDYRYGEMIEAYGRNTNRGYGRYPVFHLPRGWQSVSRLQPTASIIHSGISRVAIDQADGSTDYKYFTADFAQWSDFLDDTGRPIVQLNDGHFITHWWVLPQRATLYIDSKDSYTLDAYAITLAHQADLPASEVLSWRVEGSANLSTWNRIDTRRDVHFQRYPIREHFFFPRSANPYRYYRFTFTAARGMGGNDIFISDMKLFSAQLPTQRLP